MKIDDTAIIRQNILECCAMTLLSMAEDNPDLVVGNGMEVKCKRGGRTHRLLLLNGVWRWIDSRAVELEQKDRHSQKGGFLDRLDSRRRNRG